jgi:hypothetical protein
MNLYTVNAEQVIFHTISVLARNEDEAKSSVNEIIKTKKPLSTTQCIEITRVKEEN